MDSQGTLVTIRSTIREKNGGTGRPIRLLQEPKIGMAHTRRESRSRPKGTTETPRIAHPEETDAEYCLLILMILLESMIHSFIIMPAGE
mmetsp:Transcript_16294/g.23667  ORF Transcript_16294/g.23667 Transcript_16294/m.23667 type:complete len:89 (+) Transcript_16294:312-578(+)